MKGEIIIGSFTVDEMVEENFKEIMTSGSTTYCISVRGNEGPFKPHFHISTPNKSITDRKYKDSCMYIFINRYFLHGKQHVDSVDNILNDLDKWLREANKEHPNRSNWEQIVIEWNNTNSPVGVRNPSRYAGLSNDFSKLTQPNYTSIIDNAIDEEMLVRITRASSNYSEGVVCQGKYKDHVVFVPYETSSSHVNVKIVAILNSLYTTDTILIGLKTNGGRLMVDSNKRREANIKDAINYKSYDYVEYITKGTK